MNSWFAAWDRKEAYTLKKQVKVVFIILIIAALFAVWIGAVGINKTIHKTVNVQVYEDHDGTYKNSSITISGNLKRT